MLEGREIAGCPRSVLLAKLSVARFVGKAGTIHWYIQVKCTLVVIGLYLLEVKT